MNVIIDNLDLYLSGIWTTLSICLWSAFFALVLGTIVAAFRVGPVPQLRAFGTAWVTVLRNTPLTVVFFAIAFGLPEIGINADFFKFAVAALSLYTSSFVCEALRAGVNSVSAGQAEAARSIGLTFSQSLSLVVLPQAFRSAIPPLVSVIIAMIKNSAVAGFFGVSGDLSAVADVLTSARGLPVLPVLTGVLIGYWILVLPVAGLLGVVERKVAVAR